MFSWDDPYVSLDRIYHDHPYAFNEIQYRNFVKNYYLTPSFHNPSELVKDSTRSVDVDIDIDTEFPNADEFIHFTKLCNCTLKRLFGDSYENKNDCITKFEIPGIDLQDKAKYYNSSKSDEWTVSDVNMKARLFFILDEGYGCLVTLPAINDSVDFNNFSSILRRISKRIYYTYAASHWRMDLCSNAHAYLLEFLPDEYLVIYIECLRVLYNRKKIKTILEQLNIWGQNQKIVQRLSWAILLELIQQEPEKLTEDLSEFVWELDIKLKPVIIHIYSDRWSDSNRMLQFTRTMKKFSTIIDFPFDDSGRLRKKFEALRNHLQFELKHKKSSLFVMGWDLGALLGLLSSIKIHGYFTSVFCGVICIGLPIKGLKGERGIIPEDYIHLLSKETLIISGDMSDMGNGDDIEDFKDRMKGRVNIRHINIGGCDHLLRLSSGYAMRYKISQDVIDRLIVRNIRNFTIDQVTSLCLKSEDMIEYPELRTSESTSEKITDYYSGSTDQFQIFN